MEQKWTQAQQQVINLRDCNLLVSAAAGSGKTAVLVERIKQRILDPEHPIDVDQLLVVTFTNAAAAQMKERVLRALETQLSLEPENARLQRQTALVMNAQIITIDSFCLYVVRNYFHEIDLEPNYRIADEGELKLLQEDVLSECMERWYKEERKGFCDLVAAYAPGRSDAPVRDMLLSLYRFSQSYPWPLRWLAQVSEQYAGQENLEASPWVREAVEYAKEMLRGLFEQAKRYLMVCQESDGPDMYEKACEQDVELLESLMQYDSYEALREQLGKVKFAALGRTKAFTGSEEKQEYVKESRNACKKAVAALTRDYFSCSLEEIAAQQQRIYPCAETLIRLTMEFTEAFSAKKRERNVMDFNDVEHFALQILVDEETGKPTATARVFRGMYEEIMIDEYQDSNYVQETILRAISREEDGCFNMFMVGDVKQSIYRFRLARPELFMEKYDRYTSGEGSCQRIDLHKNFRSRSEVLNFTNDIFTQIMHRNLGGVAYDADAMLRPGREFEASASCSFDTEILLSDSDEGKAYGLDAKEQEAKLVAQRISALMETQLVTDEETGKLRPVRYKDIVILLRSTAEWADVFARVLNAGGIPAHTVSKTGYFSAMEVQTVLNYLRILDNPRQDIPLTAVLRSPIVGLDDEELARLRLIEKETSFCSCVWKAIREEEVRGTLPEVLQEKLKQFADVYDRLRGRISELPIHELLREFFSETGYDSYAAAMPGGRQRQANLHMLSEKAIAYEKTSYRGLFHFIRYIDELQKYDVDFGEADLVMENDDTVTIMSIHKSKGLEFPVCFVSGMGKRYNKMDSRSRLLIHAELGIGIDEVDVERRVKRPSFIKKIIAKKIELDNLGEELRVLYVAFTRAKDKLIVTGCEKKLAEKIESCELQNGGAPTVPFVERVSAQNLLALILPAVCNLGNRYQIRQVGIEELVLQETAQQIFVQDDLEQRIRRSNLSEEETSGWGERLADTYPYKKEADLVTKYSVSELKHRAMRAHMEREDPDATPVFAEEVVVPYVPAFMEGKEAVNQGALRGTAVHRLMECYDFTRLPDNVTEINADIEEQLTELRKTGKVTEDMNALIRRPLIAGFLKSNLAKRMRQAALSQDLFREKPFVMGLTEVDAGEESVAEVLKESDGMILIQGIIDVFWIEQDHIVLLDYKTDRVDTAEQLRDMYRKQMELYGKALQRIFHLPVTEKYLYSFRLQQVIEI
ncbi:MAG: helicase-exonuclease AddAB subunit AddA [Lachnospiraceae bacterium]|nr:helicase-exonuclease AddAB subunit AddA [Lachnospiraceae bacterium]